MQFKVYEVEEKRTATGKVLKKLVLQGEGQQYPDKGVTMWDSHPLFATIKAGDTVEGTIDKKPSDVPNPHGGFYMNKTFVEATATPSAPKTDGLVHKKLDQIIDHLSGKNKLDVTSDGTKVPDFEEDPLFGAPEL